ncbi:MAG: hypothetical protein DWQ36_00695 [Acidobacteria bacterium]|nr:MAG: hypothetical protein DWQ30_09140 [Acidobacteriota bacterium]REK11775.1 MAG: hypothetical protein DWQ36_00695 [Acidobacteriota bacterium]
MKIRSSAPEDRRDGAAKELRPLADLDAVAEACERALEHSVYDEVELLWIESRSRRLAHGGKDETTITPRFEREGHAAMQVRVREGGRQGVYRTDSWLPAALETAIRSAGAQAVRRTSTKRCPALPGADDGELPSCESLHDPELATLDQAEAMELVGSLLGDDEAAVLDWHEARILVANSHGVRRGARLTARLAQVRSGADGSRAGFASDASRRLDPQGLRGLFEIARSRRPADGDNGAPASGQALQGPVVLAPEATAQLVDLLNHRAFAADACRSGQSFLRLHTGVQVFDDRVTIHDDGTKQEGLPLPFDLEGRSKFSVALVERGVPRTPTVDTFSAHELGVEPTASCVGGQHAFGLHLFLEPGSLSEEELLQQCDGGVWISRLERIECFHPERMLVRAHGRGVRRIADGRLDHPLPEVLWEDSLLRVFSDIRGIARRLARRPSSDGFLGGITAPTVGIASVDRLEVL